MPPLPSALPLLFLLFPPQAATRGCVCVRPREGSDHDSLQYAAPSRRLEGGAVEYDGGGVIMVAGSSVMEALHLSLRQSALVVEEDLRDAHPG